MTTGHQMEIKLNLDNECVNICYETVEECLSDGGLKALFDDGLVTKCTVYSGDKRITGLPFMDWRRLEQQVASNSTAILDNSHRTSSRA